MEGERRESLRSRVRAPLRSPAERSSWRREERLPEGRVDAGEGKKGCRQESEKGMVKERDEREGRVVVEGLIKKLKINYILFHLSFYQTP